ncbi:MULTISPECIES: sensor histidine kinase [Brachybacterium]|uniref:histidine kinase n=1 Tax=Brachybacterium alimentarium TaxID=47845 RepID=A0A2A3YJ22_9MICO|nr:MULTISPECIES: ATP-binding protein [Brachybacterium]PCC39752.1 two-component sensor histidine kinase [Brachybacterium alimentarium]RCS65143.1 HAMP domain-containing protein [Brachybacterium sp. JB7]RCS77431.1 HAMP domain-containing protein [Brachybacterium alimentarium]RCS78979.1 HAMP domain-containing protein [Brachybacterium alimentarium]RCS83584.1 HAMP domain-containing protein [Brachybacterium alimentarium]
MAVTRTRDAVAEPVADSSRRGWTVRTRVLATVLAFMVGGVAIIGVLTYAAQFRVLDENVEADLHQEYRELDLVAHEKQADGSFVHTTVDSVLSTATGSAAPSDHESVLALVDGRPAHKPYSQSFELVPDQSAQSQQVLEELIAAHEPGGTVTTSMTVDGRELRLLIASVAVEGDDTEGIYVIASDIGAQKADLWRSVLTFSALSVVTLLVAGWVAHGVIGRLLRPLVSLRSATEQVTVDDLEHRIPVPRGRDDISALARNFNRMLERIQAGFAEQRRFMSDVGHELRTPLTIVRGTLETTDVEDPADVREAHEIAMDELDRMGRLVGDLSELAASVRPDYVRARPVQMEEFARSAFARIEHIAERDWVLTRTASVPADADEQRLTQAVVQLAANAVRYSDEGSTIRFGVDRVLGPSGPEIHVSMEDEGVGIAPSDQERIFERFTRGDGSRGPGSGLGLPIVRAIAEGHGGTVRLHSEPGHGSTFTLVLPQFVERAADVPREPTDPDSTPRSSS